MVGGIVSSGRWDASGVGVPGLSLETEDADRFGGMAGRTDGGSDGGDPPSPGRFRITGVRCPGIPFRSMAEQPWPKAKS